MLNDLRVVFVIIVMMGKKQTNHLPRYLPLLVGNFLGIFGWSMFFPFFAIVVQNNGGDATTIGLIWGSYTVLIGLLTLFFGRLEDKTHRLKRCLVLGNFFFLVASISYLFADSLLKIALSQMIFAVGFGLLNPAMKTLYARMQDRGKEATEWAFMDGGNALVMGSAAVIGGFIIKTFTLSTLIFVMVIVQAITTFIFYKAIRGR
jgi:MFS family permease